MKELIAVPLDNFIVFNKKDIKNDKDFLQLDDNSYIKNNIKSKLDSLTEDNEIDLVITTTRSVEEYTKLNLNVKYAIVDNGGVILNDNKPVAEYEDYINFKIDRMDLIQCILDLEKLSSVINKPILQDGRLLKLFVYNAELFDDESSIIYNIYTHLNIVRENKIAYINHRVFDKAMAVRFLQHLLDDNKLISVLVSETDMPLSSISNYVFIPEYSDLFKESYIISGRKLYKNSENFIELLDQLGSLR